jgi:hypothetical protein
MKIKFGPRIKSTGDASIKLEVLLAEYSRVQEDIRHHKTTLQAIINFMILLMAGEISALPFVSHLSGPGTLILLLFPLPFAILATYHTAYVVRIHGQVAQFDADLRVRINEMIGSETLSTYGWVPTKRPWHLGRSNIDGRYTYIALIGLKLLPQIVPIGAFIILNAHAWHWWAYLSTPAAIIVAILSSAGQND